MRKPLIAGNWKLNNTVAESLELAGALKKAFADVEDVDLVVAPVFTALGQVAALLEGTNIAMAAQNCYPEKSGAFTGEVSPALLRDVGCRFVIVGHSERRLLFGESDTFINRKVKALVDERLIPILCIGETLTEREVGRMFDVLKRQVGEGLKGLEATGRTEVVIAYEPVWAIGTGRTASSAQVEEAHRFIRDLLHEQFGAEFAARTRILYGGSVKPENADELMARPNVDGALVGGASLAFADFARIVRFKRPQIT